MSYDITLNDRVTGETLHVNSPHFMTGGTYAVGGTTELWLNITYNYAHYYYEATDGDQRFARWNNQTEEYSYGIRGIYDKTGAESIQMLKDMIARIEERYKKDGEWISTKRTKAKYFDEHGTEQDDPYKLIISGRPYTKQEYEVEVNEGPDENYWEPTAGNAIKPLYQLLAFAEMRPDGVWDGD